MTSLRMRTKPHANRAVTTVNRIAYKVSASAWASWPTHWPSFRLPQGGLHSANPNQRDQNYDLRDSAYLRRYEGSADTLPICGRRPNDNTLDCYGAGHEH